MHILRKEHGKHLDKKLRVRLRIYFLISIILIGIVLFEILTNRVSLLVAFVGLIMGIVIGMVAARMFLLSWDNNAKKVIARLDIVGGGILGLYIISSIFRGRIIGYFVKDSYITGTSIAIIAGIMIGRVFGTGHKIVEILKQQEIA